MYMLNGWWFLSSGGSYPLVFTEGVMTVSRYPSRPIGVV